MATALHGSLVAFYSYQVSTRDPVLPTCCCCADTTSLVHTLFNTELTSGILQVLSIGETVEEVSDSGFLAQAPTLRTQLLADDSMLQVS